jgi:hypothetical protein
MNYNKKQILKAAEIAGISTEIARIIVLNLDNAVTNLKKQIDSPLLGAVKIDKSKF